MSDHASFPYTGACQDYNPSQTELYLATLFYGVAITSAVFSGTMATRQTYMIWKRHHHINRYAIFVWGAWLACVGSAVTSALYLFNIVCASFYVYFFLVFLWCFEVQFVLQIIINRLALLMATRRQAQKLQWTVFGIILFVNISIFVIWIPTRMHGPPIFQHINEVWDRIQKVIFLVIDAGLNIYFVFLVRTHLIDAGFAKYKAIYRESILMIAVSISLDIVILGLMSLPTPTVYLAFEPTQYIIKLHIEMNMAELIIKVVKSPNHKTVDLTGPYGIWDGSSDKRSRVGSKPCCNHCSRAKGHGPQRNYGQITQVEVENAFSLQDIEPKPEGAIRKLVSTKVESHQIDMAHDEDDSSTTGVLREDPYF
ncbi:hypothetical protein AB5N19_03404 [Seiridium cardinale]